MQQFTWRAYASIDEAKFYLFDHMEKLANSRTVIYITDETGEQQPYVYQKNSDNRFKLVKIETMSIQRFEELLTAEIDAFIMFNKTKDQVIATILRDAKKLLPENK